MRVVVQNGDQEWMKVMRAIERDPESWNKWLCLHIQLEPKADYRSLVAPISHLASDVAQHCHELDGVSYITQDGHLFMVCRNFPKQALRLKAQMLAETLLMMHDISSAHDIYTLEYDARKLSRLCDDLGYWLHPTKKPAHASMHHPFQAMRELQSLLERNIESRQERQQPKVLLVEDEIVARKLVNKMLGDNYQMVTAPTAQDAITQYVLQAPDIVFLDIGLPDHNGFSVMDAIMEHDPNAYIVMFSSSDYAENISQSLHSGARGFVGKPFTQDRLTHYIDDCLASRAALLH